MISSEYVITKILQYTKRPIKLKYRNGYNFECPVCHEGKSAGKKRRGFYTPDQGYIYCHNCNQGWEAGKWVQLICNITYQEMKRELESYEFDSTQRVIDTHEPIKRMSFSTLPDDSINLLDEQQLKYYQSERVIRLALDIIKSRRLNTAINKPKSLWISLKDFVHKNRLVIPFYDEDNQIRFYQSRTILPEDMNDRPKYLSKLNADKRVYGINTIDPNINQLFVFEGPIDSMFVKNGIAVCGLHVTDVQRNILNKYFLYEQIWVPDNQFIDKSGLEKTEQLIEQNCRVFIWPKELRKYKDINDICIAYKLDQVSPKFILDNSFTGIEAKTKLLLTQVPL